MKKPVLIVTTCLMFALLGCNGVTAPKSGTAVEGPQRAEFVGGPVRITVKPDANGYEISVVPWQVDVQNGNDLKWKLIAAGGLDVSFKLESRRGPWGDLLTDEVTEKSVGPIKHPGGGQLARGQYDILLTITDDGKVTFIRLDPDHRVWP